MTKEMTYAEFMNSDEIKKSVNDMAEAFEKDPVASKLLDAAKTIEEMYEATKNYFQMKFEDFKKAFQMAVDYFSSEKAVLSDEVLDDVVGGWSLSSVFSSLSKKAKCIAGCVAAGVFAAVGLTTGVLCNAFGPLGSVVGAAISVGTIYLATNLVESSVNQLNS